MSPPSQYFNDRRLLSTNADSFRPAAVLIGLVERPHGLQVILTKRAMHLRHHPGQISFPGGKVEEEDASVVHTALREAKEEIGLDPKYVTEIGQLPTLDTFSRFQVTPIIAFVSPSYETQIDENEVQSVFEAPATYLFNRSNLHALQFKVKNGLHNVFAVPYKQHLIWGVTAQIIHSMQTQFSNA
ncbi:CoA pyrophosphatase [Vibrio tapetis]|uniref:Putative NUDIX hydrolase n=1 Tax=Vibrio tapetis subsp. tapetis TaxID=1671868 RepID=A0A2N8ZA93_9VIBR|nr:CoA pyrophosphatase [Vibrio tapetis]SON48821.1 putative NUDIX hydrolase [Vibrio tapetis subsp. tapetis]